MTPDVARPLEPDAVVRQQRLVVVQLPFHQVAERPHLAVPPRRNVERQPAHAHRVVGQARPAELLEQVEHELALAERVQQHRHGTDVHGVRAEPEAVAGDALQLREDRAEVPRPARHLDLHQLLDRLDVAEVVRGGRDVVHAVGEEHDVRPVAVLAQLLDAAMDVADHAVRIDDALAVEAQHDPQHAVRAGVLGPHVDHQLVGVELGGADAGSGNRHGASVRLAGYSISVSVPDPGPAASSGRLRTRNQSCGFSISNSPGPSRG